MIDRSHLKRIRSYCLVACALSLLPFYLTAQDAAGDDDVFELEEYVVTSYSESVIESIAAKRASTEVVDLVVSEDIGKFPDENVAEALQRLGGIQIQRENGEGTTVAVRGIEPNLNLVTIDGRTASDGSFGRSFDFSTLSADLVAGLKVIKSQSADMVEGGIGAVIEISTPKPLAFGQDRVGRLTAQATYNDMTEDISPKYSGLISQKFNDGKTGLLLSFSYEDFTQRTDRFGNNGWVRNAITDGPDLFTPRFFLHQALLQDRLRKGFTGAFQYRPTNKLLVTLTANVNEYTTSLANNAFNVNTPNRAAAFPDVLEENYTFNENGTGVTFDGPTNQAVPIQTYSTRVADIKGFGIDVKWNPSERWVIDFDYSYSESETDSNPKNLVDIRFLPSEFPYAKYALPEGGGVPDLSLQYSAGIDPNSPDLYVIRQLNLGRTINENSEAAAAVDVDYHFKKGFFTKFEFGGRYSDRDVSRPFMYGFPAIRPAAADRPPVIDDILAPFPIDNFLDAAGADITRSWMVVDQQKALDYLASQGYAFDVGNVDDYPANPLQLFDINEEVLAGYVKLNFSASIGNMPISGNFGVRYTETDLLSSGSASTNGAIEAVSVNRKYDDALPSFTLIMNPHEDVVLRLAGAKVMSRPNLSFMAVTRTVNLERIPVSINDGNPYLEPYRADQLDFATEWYPNDSTMLALTFFYKDVESFVSRTASTVPFEEEMLPGSTIPPGEEVLLNRPENLAGDEVEGFELNYKQVFSNLPAPFNGLGIDANYTYTKSGESPRNLIFADADLQLEDGTFPDSAFQNLPLENMSKKSYNITAFFEKGPFAMRLAYNWRERYLIQAVHFQNTPRFRDDYGQWDGRLSYRFSNKLKFTIDAINITDETTYSFYGVDSAAPNPNGKEKISEFLSTGRKIIVGLTYSF